MRSIHQQIANMRHYRVGIRRRMRDAQRLADPIARRQMLDQLALTLAMTDDDWQQLNHRAGRALPTPVKV